jgi:hypothetical protein
MTFRRLLTPAMAKFAWIVTLAFALLWVISWCWRVADAWAGAPHGDLLFQLFERIAVAILVVVLVRVFLEIAMAVAAMREKK